MPLCGGGENCANESGNIEGAGRGIVLEISFYLGNWVLYRSVFLPLSLNSASDHTLSQQRFHLIAVNCLPWRCLPLLVGVLMNDLLASRVIDLLFCLT